MSAVAKALALAGCAGLLILAASYTRTAEPAKYSPALERLASVQLLNAQADIAVMQLRHGMLHNYDSLAQLATRLEAHKAWLESAGLAELSAGDPALAADLTRASSAMGEKLLLLEEFKAANAMLKNSLHYFPRAADRASGPDVPPALLASLRTLRDVVLLMPLQPASQRYAAAEQAIQALGAAWGHTKHWAALADVAEHARHIIRLHASVEELMAKLTREPPVERLAQTFQNRLDRAIAAANAQRYLLSAICLAFLLSALLAYARLRQNARELSESQRFLGALTDTLTDGVYALDTDGKCTFMNRQAETLLGRARTELLGHRLHEIAQYRDDAAADPTISPLQAPVHVENCTFTRKDGSVLHAATVFAPLAGAAGIRGCVGAFRDVAEKRRAERDLHRLLVEQDRHASEISDLGEFGRLLQSCVSAAEAYEVIKKFCQRLFPSERGVVYIKAASGHYLEKVAEWGAGACRAQLFGPDECWALRRGQMHAVEDPTAEVVCQHVHDPAAKGSYRCVPLIAQNDTIGVLHLETADAVHGNEQLALMVSEQVALTLANIRLRESLKQQSIRDSLTGLYNRRYLEESLRRELARAERDTTPLALVMLDIDHFKRYNDTFGHSAGDLVIQTLGRVLRENIRESDIACRYGGEEFLLLLPNATLQVAIERAEALRRAVGEIELAQNGQRLGPISISLGISAYPQHGTAPEDLVELADAALYRAKRGGRNRAAVAEAPASAGCCGNAARNREGAGVAAVYESELV